MADKLKLHIVINTENKGDLQAIASLLSDFEIESLTWGAPKPTGPVYRTPDQKGGDDMFVQAARGVQRGGSLDKMEDPQGK